MRKSDGAVTSIPGGDVNAFLSDDRQAREEARARIVDHFHGFRQPLEITREKERYAYEGPDLISVEFRIGKGPPERQVRVLDVLDSSKDGLALLITQKDFDLLGLLEEGDALFGMSFGGGGARIKEDGVVRHKTRIEDGEMKGCWILGVEARDAV